MDHQLPSIVHTTMWLNNTAAAHHHCGNIEEATRFFRMALNASREVILHNQNRSLSSKDADASRNTTQNMSYTRRSLGTICDAKPEHCSSLTHQTRVALAAALGNSVVPSFLQLDPILMQESEYLEGSISCLTLGLICTFNLAVTLHTKDLLTNKDTSSSPNTSRQLSQGTLRLYELAYSLLAEHSVQMDHYSPAACSKTTWKISFSILNNLGLLYKQLGFQEKARQAFQTLLSLIMCKREQERFAMEESSSSSSSGEDTISQRLEDEFYANAITELGILKLPISAASA